MNLALIIRAAALLLSFSAVVSLGAVILGRRRAALRHRWITVGFGVLLLLPSMVMLMPSSWQWHVSMLPAAAPQLDEGETRPPDVGGAEGAKPTIAISTHDSGRVADPLTSTSSSGDAGPTADSVLLGVFLLVGIAGCSRVVAQQMAASLALRALVRRGDSNPAVTRETERLALRVGVDRPLRVHLCDELATPVTWGLWKTHVALPSGFRRWPKQRREVCLLHELAHIQRKDSLALGCVRLTLIVHWWNPLVRWLARIARGDAEVAADNMVLGWGVDFGHYARELLAVLEESRETLAARAGVPLGGGMGLRRRIETLAEQPRSSGIPTRRSAWLCVLLLMVVATGVAAARPSPPAEPTRGHLPVSLPETQSVVERVRRVLADPVPMVRRSAVNALRDLEGRRVRQDTALRELLHDPDPEVRRTAETVLGLRPAKPNLRFRDEPWHRRTPRAAELKGLRATLRSSSSKDRERAVHELATLVGDGVIPMLLGALKDESKQVRQAAAEAAGDTGDPQVLPALTLALRDSNEHVRQAAAGSFGKIGPAAAEWLPALIAATGDPNEHVRQAAVDALGDLAHPAATNALLASLADPNPFVRQGALDSLVELRRSSQRAH